MQSRSEAKARGALGETVNVPVVVMLLKVED